MLRWFRSWTNRRLCKVAVVLTLIAAALVAAHGIKIARPPTFAGVGPFFRIHGGRVCFGRAEPPVSADWWYSASFARRVGGVDWFSPGRGWVFAASIGRPTAAAVVSASLAWGWLLRRVLAAWLRQGSDPGRCFSCGYNLAGLAEDAVCPECGAARGEVEEVVV
jgi:hypothetical protein